LYSMKIVSYEQVPSHLVDGVVAEAKQEEE
jgi:hypothetical protein